MPTVKIRTAGLFIEKFGFKELKVNFEGKTLADLLKYLSTMLGSKFSNEILNDDGEVRPYIIILINGRAATVLGGLKAVLKDGDEVSIFPPSIGG